MPLPHLHILHPPESRLPGIGQWLAEVQSLLQVEADWDRCVVRTASYYERASIHVPTQTDLIRRNLGPVILIQNVQGLVRDRMELLLSRETCIYCIEASCAEDIYAACDTARLQYEDGEPRIPVREALAFLIVRKLAMMDRWGGTSVNKNFLWAEDLPKGGFPKDLLERREILDIAEALVKFGVLTYKTSSGQRKYALERREIIQPILDQKSFISHPRHRDLRGYFERKADRVTVRVLDYNE